MDSGHVTEHLDWEFLGLRFLSTWAERKNGVCCAGICRRQPVAEISTPLGRLTYCARHIEAMAYSVIEYATAEGHYVG